MTVKTLRQWREDEGLSREQMGARLGITGVAVSRYESGRVPEPKIMARIWDVTDGAVSPNSFYAFSVMQVAA